MLYARYSQTGGDLRSIFTGSNITREFPVRDAARVMDKNIGVVENGVISGVAFLDLNCNGHLDEGEPGYAGVTVEALRGSGSESQGKTGTRRGRRLPPGGPARRRLPAARHFAGRRLHLLRDRRGRRIRGQPL